MDITIDIEEYKLNIRAGGVIVHDNKVLFHKCTNNSHYAVLGGRVKIGESSEQAIKREVFEELGKEVEIIEYIATIENFFEMKEKKYHEILFIYKLEFKDEKDKLITKALNNIEKKEYLKYEWVDMKEIKEKDIRPKAIKEILLDNKFPVHKINKG